MPKKEKEIQKALDGVDSQIKDLVSNFVKLRKKHYEELTRKLHTGLEADARRYAELFAEEKISKSDFELLLKGRWAQLKIELMTEMSGSKRKFEGIATDLLRVTTHALIAAI